MPWKAQDIMSLKQEFVLLAQHQGSQPPGVVPALWNQPANSL